MESKTFEPTKYFAELAKENNLCREKKFQVVYCSGPENLDGILQDFRTTENFIVIDDTTDNNVYGHKPGFFVKSVYTVWVLASVDFDDSGQRMERMKMCREVFRQFLSRMIADQSSYVYGNALSYLALDNIYYKELGRYSINGATGLYFMVTNDMPTDYAYNAEEWLRG